MLAFDYTGLVYVCSGRGREGLMDDLAALPGFRRRFLVTPQPDCVTAAVEDDYHCMAVTLHHDGATIARIEAEMDRAPWTTCPGAAGVLKSTFEGATLQALLMQVEAD